MCNFGVRQVYLWTSVVVTAIISSISLAQAAEEVAKPLQWWQVVGGIIAIPTGIIGIFSAYFVIKKTILESKKIELEIREKESQLTALTEQQAEVAASVIKPFVDTIVNSQKYHSLILRFIILYLLLLFWEILEKFVGIGVTGIIVSAQYLFNTSLSGTSPLVVFVITVQQLVKVGWFAIIIIFAWPLYKEISEQMGFSMRDRLWIRKKPASDGA